MATNKLILTHEVNKLGVAGDVVEVKAGYARNYLIPRRLATPWTKGGEAQVEAIRRARKAREVANLDDARALRDAVEAEGVTVTAAASRKVACSVPCPLRQSLMRLLRRDTVLTAVKSRSRTPLSQPVTTP